MTGPIVAVQAQHLSYGFRMRSVAHRTVGRTLVLTLLTITAACSGSYSSGSAGGESGGSGGAMGGLGGASAGAGDGTAGGTGGALVDCGLPGQACCAGNVCTTPQHICSADGTCVHCGSEGERCCGLNSCDDELTCLGGLCVATGCPESRPAIGSSCILPPGTSFCAYDISSGLDLGCWCTDGSWECNYISPIPP